MPSIPISTPDGPLRFNCTQCARCCRNLLESKAKGLPPEALEAAGHGIYHLPRSGGLMAWAWEARAMRQAAMRRGVVLDFRPSTGIVVSRDAAKEFVTLVYELQQNECPLLASSNLCGAYEERPVVCRAYPLLLTGPSVTISTHCPGHVIPAPEHLREAYGPAARAVSWAHELPGVVMRYLKFLADAGAITLSRVPLPEAQVLGRGAASDLVDLLDGAGAYEGFVQHVESAQRSIEGTCQGWPARPSA
ncbi:MAG: YkgJ family cysteine cluster protein [Thermoplasmatota archaeon]